MMDPYVRGRRAAPDDAGFLARWGTWLLTLLVALVILGLLIPVFLWTRGTKKTVNNLEDIQAPSPYPSPSQASTRWPSASQAPTAWPTTTPAATLYPSHVPFPSIIDAVCVDVPVLVNATCVDECINLTQSMIPYTATANNVCLRLAENIVWNANVSSNYFAITWVGRAGRLYGNGYNVSVNGLGFLTVPAQQFGALLVRGNYNADQGLPGAELYVEDFHVQAPEQIFASTNLMIHARFGATLDLNRITVRNASYGVRCTACKMNAAHVNVTAVLWQQDPNIPAYQAANTISPFELSMGVRCFGAVDCILYDIHYHATVNDTAGDYRTQIMPMQSFGIQCLHNQNLGTVGWSPGNCQLDTFTVTAHIGVDILRSKGTIVRNGDITVLGFTQSKFNYTARGPIIGPGAMDSNYPMGKQYGLNLGCGNVSNVIVDSVNIDSRGVTATAPNFGMRVATTLGIIINRITIMGVAPRATWPLRNVPNQPAWSLNITEQAALFTIQPLPETFYQKPIMVNQLTLNVLDSTSYGISVLNYDIVNSAWVPPGLNRIKNATLMLTNSAIDGGAVGVLLGSGSTQLVTMRNVDIHGSYYGMYAYNGSKNVFMNDCVIAQTCEAIHVEPSARNVAAAGGALMDNSINVQDLSGVDVVISSSVTQLTPTGAVCTSAPFIYDSSQYLAPGE